MDTDRCSSPGELWARPRDSDPSVLKLPGKRYTDPAVFMKAARRVRFLGELIGDAELVSDKFLTATNYSRISEHMCDCDTDEIRIGDGAYFVDPLFSAGVHFARLHSAVALALIKGRFSGERGQFLVRELWADYDGMLRTIARGFALGIDPRHNEIPSRCARTST